VSQTRCSGDTKLQRERGGGGRGRGGKTNALQFRIYLSMCNACLLPLKGKLRGTFRVFMKSLYSVMDRNNRNMEKKKKHTHCI